MANNWRGKSRSGFEFQSAAHGVVLINKTCISAARCVNQGIKQYDYTDFHTSFGTLNKNRPFGRTEFKAIWNELLVKAADGTIDSLDPENAKQPDSAAVAAPVAKQVKTKKVAGARAA